MKQNSRRSDNSHRLSIQCTCGKRFAVPLQARAKQLKCPACGSQLEIPGHPLTADAANAVPPEQMDGLSRSAIIGMWSVIGTVVLGCVMVLFLYSRSSHQARIAAANERVARAVDHANDWISGNSGNNSEAIERNLTEALSSEDATDKTSATTVLNQVRQKRAERQSTALFNQAKEHIESKQVQEGLLLLRSYVSSPHALEKAEAERLIIEAETALSDVMTFDALVAIDDETFERTKTTGKLDDSKITHPVLLAVREETIHRNLVKVTARRNELKIAEQARQQREEERRKQEEARQAEEERLRTERERPIDGTELFTQITTFPERYIGMNYYIRGFLYPDGTQRNKEYKCFSIQFASKAAVSGGPRRDRLSFITTEEMGARLVEMRKGDYEATVHVTLRYLDPGTQEYPVGNVTMIEFWQFDFEAGKKYKAITIYDNGKGDVHPNPFKS